MGQGANAARDMIRPNVRRVHPLDACQRIYPVESFEWALVEEELVGLAPRRIGLVWVVASVIGSLLGLAVAIWIDRGDTLLAQAGLIGAVGYLIVRLVLMERADRRWWDVQRMQLDRIRNRDR